MFEHWEFKVTAQQINHSFAQGCESKLCFPFNKILAKDKQNCPHTKAIIDNETNVTMVTLKELYFIKRIQLITFV